MDTSFRLFPDEASSRAFAVDGLALFITAITIFFSILVAAMVVYFAVRYRRRPGTPHVPKPDPSHTQLGFMLELTWTIIPILIVTVMFLAGAKVFVRAQQPPSNAKEIYIEGKRWMWKTQDVATGTREINGLHLPTGVPVRLIMISEDVIHDFGIPAFRVKQDVVPGRYTSEWFIPEKPGEYHLFCDQYCGTDHAKMQGTITVMEPAKYRQWLDGHTADDPPRIAGEKLFGQYGCITCHSTRAPTMAGLYGRQVALEGGSTVIADDAYLRESIYYPSAKIVKGFPPLMPSFRGQLTEEQVMDLVEYIKSLAGATTDPFELPGIGGPTTQPNRAVPGPGPFVPVQQPQGSPR
jgi:cytochrome c oxidase subunit II